MKVGVRDIVFVEEGVEEAVGVRDGVELGVREAVLVLLGT